MPVGHLQVEMHSVHEVYDLSSYPWGVRYLLVPSAGVALVASPCSSPPALASGYWGSGGGGSGSVVSSSGAGGLGVGVVETCFGLNPKADAVLMKQNQLSNKSKWNRRYIMNKELHLQ
jgi:hypothetical protein